MRRGGVGVLLRPLPFRLPVWQRLNSGSYKWAMAVSGNWRITFAFDGENVIVVNLEDYH
jgi:proteic killer suppression protein